MLDRTLPRQLVANAQRLSGSQAALRVKRFGIWQTLSWPRYHERVRAAALGLQAQGLERGQTVLILGTNRPGAYIMQVAVQSLGAIAVPLHPDVDEAECRRVIQELGAVGAFCEGLEYVDRVSNTLTPKTGLRWIIYEEGRGLTVENDPRFQDLENVVAAGEGLAQQNPEAFPKLLEAGQSDDVAVIVYSAGVRGPARPVRLTHGNLLAAASALVTAEGLTSADEIMALLPIGWVADVEFSLVIPLVTGCAVSCPEDSETLLANIREIGPTILYATPRFWNRLRASTQARLEGSDGLKQLLYRRTLEAIGKKARDLSPATGQTVSAGTNPLERWLVLDPLRDHLGLSRIRHAYCGGGTPSLETLAFFRGLGVDLKCAYTVTEAAGVVAVQPSSEVEAETAGRPLPGLEVQVNPAGEVLIRGESVSSGSSGAAASVVDAAGWFRPGDTGEFLPSGQLRIVERSSLTGRLTDGTPFTPSLIESQLEASPYVSQAVAFGDGQAEVSAAISIDADTVGQWATRRNVIARGYAEMAALDAVGDLVRDAVEAANQRLPEGLGVRRFILLPWELSPGDGVMTRTGVIRRQAFAERYPAIERTLAAAADGGAPAPAGTDGEFRVWSTVGESRVTANRT